MAHGLAPGHTRLCPATHRHGTAQPLNLHVPWHGQPIWHPFSNVVSDFSHKVTNGMGIIDVNMFGRNKRFYKNGVEKGVLMLLMNMKTNARHKLLSVCFTKEAFSNRSNPIRDIIMYLTKQSIYENVYLK